MVLKLENIQPGSRIEGLNPNEPVQVITAIPMGPDAVTVYYKLANGNVHEHVLFRSDELNLSLATEGRHFAFTADADSFKLAAEAYRIDVAHLFDPMMAVHTSNVEPLPHQIAAVYESMLSRQPLRFVLADDPGAGKTIMAGLFIRELLIRGDAERIMIIAPGSLADQWRDELKEKFDLDFDILSQDMIQNPRTGNPFEERDMLIVRLDAASRSAELQDKLKQTTFDLVVVDEAHKMSAHWFGDKIEETKRYKLGMLAGSVSRHFLLMTATPHNGKEEDFQLFLRLLDSDRFYGKFRTAAQKVDVKDLMRRMVKEELVKFDGTRLFPERRATTVNYELSDSEEALYQRVTKYVKEEMDRADKLNDKKRKGTVGFALTSLQRRLASSPEAIFQSIKRRKERLKKRVEELKQDRRDRDVFGNLPDVPEDIYESQDEMNGQRYEEFENEVVSQATAAKTIRELENEINVLVELEALAREVVSSDRDTKWSKLSELLHDEPLMRDASGNRRKLIIFTEHKDTLHYLDRKITRYLGVPNAVVTIHGGVKREERLKVQERFRFDKDVLILIATDAAGEGVNLQNANLMVNYDLPWNPNRLEQRFGRIHRIGQREVCHLWNLVAKATREGEVYHRLLEKLEIERKALDGRVFDILGDVFEHTSLKDLLIEAIRYGDDPAVRARLEEQVDSVFDKEHITDILHRNALTAEVMTLDQLYKVKDEMERAEARRLQPHFIRSFFLEAFKQLGGAVRKRESDRYQIDRVPFKIRERDRLISGRSRNQAPVLEKYERVCFEKPLISIEGKTAALLHTGHPLMQAVVDLILEEERGKLKQGTILIDDEDDSVTPRVLFMLDHSVREQVPVNNIHRDVSRRVQYISITEDGRVSSAGYAPHLDLRTPTEEELMILDDVKESPWLTQSLESMVMNYAIEHLAAPHYQEIKERRTQEADRIWTAVDERLKKEIYYWQDRHLKITEEIQAGKQPKVNADNIRKTMNDLKNRMEKRRNELNQSKHVISVSPVLVGAALVIPAGLLRQRTGQGASVDHLARKRIERIAMERVMEVERALGHEVYDVSADKCGWDITAKIPLGDGRYEEKERHIEVKGRQKGQDTITVTYSEVLYGLNQGDKFILAIVLVDGDEVDGPYYIRHPFQEKPDWAEVSKTLDLNKLLGRAEKIQP